MKSSEALLRLARSASQASNHKHSAAVASRLLSHSQASTSAASSDDMSEAPIHTANQLGQLRCARGLAAMHASREHRSLAAQARKLSSSTVHQARDRSTTGSHQGAAGSRQQSRQAANADNSGAQDWHSAKIAAEAEPAPDSDSSDSGRSSGAADSSEPPENEEELRFGYVADGPFPHPSSAVEVVNLAGTTETTWEFLGGMDEEAIVWYGMDFTRGTCPEVERNALLSNEAKEMMYQMHKHDKKR